MRELHIRHGASERSQLLGGQRIYGRVKHRRFHGEILDEFYQGVAQRTFLLGKPHPLVIGQTDGIGTGGKAHVSVILAEKYAVFGAGGKHSVRLVNTFRHQVIDKNADISLVAGESELTLFTAPERGVDTRKKPLSGGLLIAGGAVDLTGEIQP